MNLNVTCPFCENENAFHNGWNYECPDCDSAWDEHGNKLNDDEDDEDEIKEDETYKENAALQTPFFTLKHGQLYKCKYFCQWHFHFIFKIAPDSIVPNFYKVHLYEILYCLRFLIEHYFCVKQCPKRILVFFECQWDDVI